MKIDRSKVKKSCSEVPLDCRNLIDKLKVGYSIRLNFFPFKFSKGIQSLSYKLYPVLVLVGSGNSFFFGSSTSLEFLNWLLSNFNDLISLVGLFTHRVPERAERHRNMDLREVRALPLDWHTRPLWWHPTGRYPTGAWVMGKFQRLGYEVVHELTIYPFQPHFSRKLFAIKKKGWWKEESGGLERCIDDRLMQVYVNLCVMAWMTGARLRPTGRGRGEA